MEFASAIKREFKSRLDPRIAGSVERSFGNLAPRLMQFAQYWPYAHESNTYVRTRDADGSSDHASDGLPVPPPEYWATYGTTVEAFLKSGYEDIETMRRLLAENGLSIEQLGRILDLGCAGGRMIRWLVDVARTEEVWGTDIWSDPIFWCQDHLSPPFNFATTTMAPHLPFEDRSFGLVYGGSLFTHIDDLAEAWFLELRRILHPGGRLYFSVNDRHTTQIFEGEGDPEKYEWYYERAGGKDKWDQFTAALHKAEGYEAFRDGRAYMLTVGRSMWAHVLWDPEALCRRLAYGFRPLAVTQEAYGHQTTVLLERL